MNSDDDIEQSVMDLSANVRDLERQIDDQIQWLKDMIPQIISTCAQNNYMNEFIIDSLQAGVQSCGFTLIIKNYPRSFLSDITLDISKYVTLESPVFDIIMNAGYKPERLRDLDRTILNVFTFNYCLPYMPMWRIIVARVTKLAQTDRIVNVNWDAAVRIFDVNCSHNRDYIQQHAEVEPWTAATKELRAAMTAAGSIIQAC